MSRAWKCILLWRTSILGGAFKQERAREKKRGGAGAGERVFQRIRSHIILKYTPSSYEIKDLIETHLANIVCDTPIARMNRICRGLLCARCWV